MKKNHIRGRTPEEVVRLMHGNPQRLKEGGFHYPMTDEEKQRAKDYIERLNNDLDNLEAPNLSTLSERDEEKKMNIIKKFRKIFTMGKDLREAQIDATEAKIYAQEARSNVEKITTQWGEELEKKLETLQLQYRILATLLEEYVNLTKSNKKEGE